MNIETNLLTEQLKLLTKEVCELAKVDILSGILKPSLVGIQTYVLNDFSYNEHGVIVSSYYTEHKHEQYWVDVFIAVFEKAQRLSSYKRVYTILQQFKFEYLNPGTALYQYIIRVLNVFIEDISDLEFELDNLLKRFLADITGNAILCQVTVNLIGFTIESSSILVNKNIFLRQTTQLDCETKMNQFMAERIPTHPSAVLEIKLEITEGEVNKISDLVEKIVRTISLVGVGPIDWMDYTMNANTICRLMSGGRWTHGNSKKQSVGVYYLEKSKEADFLIFVNSFSLPQNLYELNYKASNHLSIAFDRYRDALFDTRLFDRQIAEVMMGLEALYSDDNMEISFKLRIRVARFLSLIKYDALEIKKSLNLGYAVRSKFAHGNILTRESSTHKSIVNEFSNYNTFLKNLQDYLRLSIVVFILISESKKTLIPLIDDACISDSKLVELKTKVDNIMSLLIR